MALSRRKFAQGCATALAAYTWLPRRVPAAPRRAERHVLNGLPRTVLVERFDPALLRKLAERALDAATSAGATYADVRLTRIIQSGQTDVEELAVGVRALAGGSWGFAASPFLELEEMPILAAAAVAQAKSTVFARTPPIELVKTPSVSGDWAMPVEIDPLTVPAEELADFVTAFMRYVAEYRPGLSADFQLSRSRKEQALATTDGSYVTQMTWLTPADVTITLVRNGKRVALPMRKMHLAGRGWEIFRDAKLVEQLPEIVEQLESLMALSSRPLDVGRYDVVCDAQTMASLLSSTIGAATELDRAIGLEANAGGTSYLGPDPLALLGNFAAAAPVVNITADRSLPGGSATVRWDNEGAEPQTAHLVSNGFVTDYQTTREHASRLASWYAKRGIVPRSHGYAASASALDATTQFRPNLSLVPSSTSSTMAALVADVKDGIAIYGGYAMMDFQAKNGVMNVLWRMREIKNGKLGQVIDGPMPMFSSTELWKNISAIGDATTAEAYDLWSQKGEPRQSMHHTVTAVPARIKNVAFVNAGVKA